MTQNHFGVSSYIQNHTKPLCGQTLFDSQSHTKSVFMYPINQFVCHSYVGKNMVTLDGPNGGLIYFLKRVFPH